MIHLSILNRKIESCEKLQLDVKGLIKQLIQVNGSISSDIAQLYREAIQDNNGKSSGLEDFKDLQSISSMNKRAAMNVGASLRKIRSLKNFQISAGEG